ncbi:MAG: class I SAM-dependent methyltransferase [Cyclobacteriaceae bacterium]|nr:class I SAM-dependent methyltransferase [Cyclobacteriaceae bacterium]
MSTLHQAKSFIRHWLYEVDDHSIHSPYFYDLYTKLVTRKHPDGLPVLEDLRRDLESNKTVLDVEDFGSGGQGTIRKRTIGEIARTSLTPYKWAMFFLDLLYHSNSKRVVELGTSLGLTTLYLAQKTDATIYTFEGSHAIANVAMTNFEWAGKKNIKVIEGNLDQTLHRFLEPTDKIDFVLMDANHRYVPTLEYYRLLTRRLKSSSLVVIDDIHRSEEMEKAWEEIRTDTLVYGSVDLYRCGLLCFDPALNKQHYVWSLK